MWTFSLMISVKIDSNGEMIDSNNGNLFSIKEIRIIENSFFRINFAIISLVLARYQFKLNPDGNYYF